MVLTNCGMLSDKLFINYLDRLVGRFYKILTLQEDNNPTILEYIKSLQSELIGSKRLVVALNDDARFMTLINTLQFFLDNEFNHAVCKKEVMKCINISKQLKSVYFPVERDADD